MVRTLSCGRGRTLLVLATFLPSLFVLGARGQSPAQKEPPGAGDRSQQNTEAVKQAEADLQIKRAELLLIETRLKAELELKRAEIRVAEERLKLAKNLQDQRVEARPAGGAALVSPEQRLQQLEQKLQLLQKELEGLRKHPPAQQAAGKSFSPLNLQAQMNHKRKDDFHSGRFPGNSLASLPAGEQTFQGIKFQIGDGVIQLGSMLLPDKPEKVEGIKVGQKVRRLHALHATGYGPEEQQETRIGAYTIHYDQGPSAMIPIVYGRDVLDWWKYPGASDPTRGKVAWEGTNDASKGFEATIRLYLLSWDNPHPDKVVTRIDFASTMDTPCAPFCVALTAEEP